MRLLLDTHALAWWANGGNELTRTAYEAIADSANQVFVSAVSFYEASLKHHLGKWPEAALLLADAQGYLDAQEFVPAALTIGHAQLAGSLPLHHRDPFDRMLVAQSLIDDLTLVSNEELFDQFGVPRLW